MRAFAALPDIGFQLVCVCCGNWEVSRIFIFAIVDVLAQSLQFAVLTRQSACQAIIKNLQRESLSMLKRRESL